MDRKEEWRASEAGRRMVREMPGITNCRAAAHAIFGVVILLFLPVRIEAGHESSAPGGTESASSLRPWESDEPCTSGPGAVLLKVFDPPEETELPDCVAAACVALNPHLRVCLCQFDSPSDGRLIVEQDGQRLHSLETEVFGWIGPGSTYFDVLSGDLDGDRISELIVPHLLTFSNGTPFGHWSVAVFDGRDMSRKPVEIPVAEYGRHGTFMRPSADGPFAYCQLAGCMTAN